MKQKGRTPPLPHIDHASALRDRLGKTVAEQFNPGVKWETYAGVQREQYRAIGQAVMDVIVVQGDRRGDFSVSSIYGYASKKPYVNVEVSVSPMQLSPAKAREIALMLLESADASESDAVLMGYARDVLDLNEQGSAQLLNQFRAYRERQRGKAAESA
jgi:hypothetical protein